MNLLEECSGAKKIGISGHIRPDGDCVASTMALFQFLNRAMVDASVEVLLEKPSEVFVDISGVSKIISEEIETKIYDVFFVLDSVSDRIGLAKKHFDHAKKTINVDHHISNYGSADVNFLNPHASSTSEMIYELILIADPEKKYMDEELAKTLYIGIIHDTGVLQYSNTSPRTLCIAADLISYGFDFSEIIDKTFYEKTYIQNQIMGRAILESVRFMDGKCVVSMVDSKMMEFYGATSKDFEGIVNQLRIIKGVECAIFMYETGSMEYKVSMRSMGKVNVSAVATYFGGGGHVRAAGCNMSGTYHDVINNLSSQIERQLKK